MHQPEYIAPSGVESSSQFSRENAPYPEKLIGRVANSLQRAARDYAMVMPYMLPLVRPMCEFEPFQEAYGSTGKPNKHVFLPLPYSIFELGIQGQRMGLHGAVLHGIPRPQWQDFVTFLKSCAIFDQDTQDQFVIGVQRLEVLDPMWKPHGSGQLDPIVRIAAIVVADEKQLYYWVPANIRGGVATSFKPAVTKNATAGSGITMLDAFTAGDSDPFSTVEQIHGLRDLTPKRPE